MARLNVSDPATLREEFAVKEMAGCSVETLKSPTQQYIKTMQ